MKQEETAHRIYVLEQDKKKVLAEREKQLKVCQKTYKDGKAELQKEQEVFVAGVQQEIDTESCKRKNGNRN